MQAVVISIAALSFFIIFIISPISGIAYLTAARNVFSWTYASGEAFDLSAEGVVTFLIIILGIFSVGRYRNVKFRSATVWTFVLFIAVGAVTFYVADDHINFVKKLLRLIGYLFLYLLVQRITVDKRQIRILSVAMIVSILITIPPALYYFSGHQEMTAATAQLDEKMGLLSKNNFGFYASYMAIFLLYPLAFRLAPLSRSVTYLAFPALIASLFLSYTRAAWVSFFVALVVFILLSDVRKKIIIPVLIASVVVALFSSVLYKGLYVDTTHKRQYGMSSWDYRTKLAWPASIKCIEERPVLGSGLGNDMHAMKSIAHFGNSSHNDYLLVAVETGGIGLFCYLLLLGAMFLRTYKAFRSAEDREIRYFCLVTLSVFTSFIVGSVAEHLLQTPGATGYVITMLGMAHGITNAMQSKQAGSAA